MTMHVFLFQVLKLLKARAELPAELRFEVMRIGQASAVHPDVQKSAFIDTLINENVKK